MQRDKRVTRTEYSYVVCGHRVKFIISLSKDIYEKEKNIIYFQARAETYL